MIKTLIAASLLTVAFSVPSFAAMKKMDHMDHMAKCDAGTFAMINDAIKKDTDPKMAKDVKVATNEVHVAEMAMKAHKMNDCSMHLGMAKKHMMMK